jgi:hypothetical protein
MPETDSGINTPPLENECHEHIGPQLPDFTTVMDACRGRLHKRLSELLSLEQLCRRAEPKP